MGAFDAGFFHLAFIIVFVGMMAIRAIYHHKAQKSQGQVTYQEQRMTRLRRILGLPFPLLLLLYMLNPASLDWFSFPLARWVQWIGLALGLLSLPMTWWVQWALGANFSDVLHVRYEHTLVRHGPYKWVRHPMYMTLFLNGIAVLLLTGNWLIGGFYLVSLTLIVVLRINKEEEAMIAKFGDSYREYMLATHRFLPRVFRR